MAEALPLPQFEVVPAPEYPQRLQAAIDEAQGRIGLLAMVMGIDAATEPIFAGAEQAAIRHVPALVLPDAYSRLFDDNVPAQPLTARGREARLQTERLRQKIGELGVSGATASYIHEYEPGISPRSLNPFAGRNHAKISIADNDVFTGGGINLRQRYFASIDYMLHADKPELADFLYDYFEELAVCGRVLGDDPYRRYDIDDDSSLVVDHGLPGQSLIYEAATRLVNTAVELTLVTQYPPKGKFRSLLAERQHTLPAGAVKIFHNVPGQFRIPGAFLRKIEQTLPPQLITHGSPNGRFIHVKALFGRLEDGMPFVVSGSHNFQQSLVRMGTAEVAIISTSPRLYADVSTYLHTALRLEELA